MCSCKYVLLRCPLKWEGINSGIISNGTEYFDIVHSEGDVYISINVTKMHWLFVQTQPALCTAIGQCFNVSTVLLLHDFIFCLYDKRHPFFVIVQCCKEIPQVSLGLLPPELICMNGT